MRVRFRNPDMAKCPPQVEPYARDPNLTPEREYEVHAVSVFHGVVAVLVFDEANYPAWLPIWLFTPTELGIPTDWICNAFLDWPELLMGPEFIAASQESYIAMAELQRSQVERLRHRVAFDPLNAKLTLSVFWETVHDALARAWVLGQAGDDPQAVDTIRAVLATADSFLGSDAVDSESVEFDALVEISWLSPSKLDETVAGLESALQQLGLPLPSFQKRLALIEPMVSRLMAEASTAQDFAAARPALKAVYRLSGLAAKVGFTNELPLSDTMEKLVRDFGHGCDDAFLNNIFKRHRVKPQSK